MVPGTLPPPCVVPERSSPEIPNADQAAGNASDAGQYRAVPLPRRTHYLRLLPALASDHDLGAGTDARRGALRAKHGFQATEPAALLAFIRDGHVVVDAVLVALKFGMTKHQANGVLGRAFRRGWIRRFKRGSYGL